MTTTEEKKSTFMSEAMGWIQAILFAVIIALIIRGFIFEPVEVDGISMENTLLSEQRLIVYKLGYLFSSPQRGDVVVVIVQDRATEKFPFLAKTPLLRRIIPGVDEVDYIKRVIGVPGDKILIENEKVFVNGKELPEPYAKGSTTVPGKTLSLTVEENKVFVLGDNRQNSHDSRQIGQIDYKKVKGKAIFRIWPFKNIGRI